MSLQIVQGKTVDIKKNIICHKGNDRKGDKELKSTGKGRETMQIIT